MELHLRGKGVLLVGGTRGIGRAAAELLAAEGVRLALVGRDPEALRATAEAVRQRGGQVREIPADITDPAQVERLVGAARDFLGRFDAVIDAVGRGVRGAFPELDEATWREAFELDFFSAVRLVRGALPFIPAGGRIVLVGAASGKQPQRGQAPSNAAKAALANLTRSLADELAPRQIAVNCVAPGRVLTERRRARLLAEARQQGISPEEALARDAADVPLGRHGDPEEVAAVIVFLASPRAGYLTGQQIVVDGGLVRTL
jgi:3-oxoacyl-[acyl-carrier protein] reductase